MYIARAEFLPDNPFDTLTLGCDFVRNHAPPDIDFCSIHLWPDSWLPGAAKDSEEAALRFARRWINAHVDACCSQLGKPLVLAEFGKKPAGAPRAAFYQKVGSAKNNGPLKLALVCRIVENLQTSGGDLACSARARGDQAPKGCEGNSRQ